MLHLLGCALMLWLFRSSSQLNIFSHPSHWNKLEHWCPGKNVVSQFWQFSSLVLRMREEQFSDVVDSLCSRRFSGLAANSVAVVLCFILTCCLSPFSEAAWNSQWSHLGAFEEATSLSVGILAEGLCCFLWLNSSLRLAFLLSVEGLAFFLVPGTLLLVSKEKEKVESIASEKLMTWPWLASAWQKSMHLETRVELTSSTAAILGLLLN